jgi:hypothetical protein
MQSNGILSYSAAGFSVSLLLPRISQRDFPFRHRYLVFRSGISRFATVISHSALVFCASQRNAAFRRRKTLFRTGPKQVAHFRYLCSRQKKQ